MNVASLAVPPADLSGQVQKAIDLALQIAPGDVSSVFAPFT